MTDNVGKIKDRLDIVDLVGDYLKLQKSGINHKARCPFHNEKTPSFFVNPERQIWHCFGCSKGGDHFEFVKEIEGVDFPEALRMLAKRAGVDLQPLTPEFKQYQSEKTRLYDISELAAKFFEKQLWQSGTGKKVLAYLHERGLADESIRKFRLGYAPDSWNALSDFLAGKDYSSEEIIKSGMAIKKETGNQQSVIGNRIYDRFRNRIVFPVTDLSGQVVGFSGRIFEQQIKLNDSPDALVGTPTSDFDQAPKGPDKNQNVGAKYINTPQTPIYDKSKILYGLDKARLDIRSKNRCLAVEGNMDVIMSHQAGASNVVATSGTALTDWHLKIIKRYTDNLDLCFDEDEAGQIAARRGVDLALKRGFNVGMISIDEPDLKDPADYVKKHGSKWAEYSSRPKPFMEVFFRKVLKTIDTATALGKKTATQKLLPLIKAISNKVEQSHWISELALKVKTREDLLYRELAEIKTAFQPNEPDKSLSSDGGQNFAGLKNYERGIAEIIAARPALAGAVDLKLDLWSNDFIQISRLLDSSKDDPHVKVLRFRAGQVWDGFDEEGMKNELEKLICRARLENIREGLENLSFRIKEAELAGDKKQLSELLAKFSKLSNQLTSLV